LALLGSAYEMIKVDHAVMDTVTAVDYLLRFQSVHGKQTANQATAHTTLQQRHSFSSISTSNQAWHTQQQHAAA
jgi:alpha-D-ribose 1-methylphosphonate 5-phosphate C-P lyase